MSSLSEIDPNSFSNPEEVLCTHIHLDLDIDFKRHVLSGKANLSLSKLKDGVDQVFLDTRELTIKKIYDKDSGQELTYELCDPVTYFGQKLEVQLPNRVLFSTERDCVITIEYETSSEASALQWLRPSQTAGKRHPYLFSQGQAVHTRSIVPCQDTPSVKMPYTARMVAPAAITVLMSALSEESFLCKDDASKMEFHFKQPVPVPSYLIAIVAGDLVSRPIGPRTMVWAEMEYADKSAAEFVDTEAMIRIAEDMLGPYVWGRYDLLVLPPCFPYGGMENPCLTFVTPTLLAGDRSLADVVAHEIAHSWTGNLVSIKTQEHFWLNEGNTEFCERKIASKLRGGEKYRSFLASLGWNTLDECVRVLESDGQLQYTKLVPDMRGVDPDDIYSSIPYEKGHAFLLYIEQLVGGPEVFEGFLKAYVEKFKYKSITTWDWKAFLLEYFSDLVEEGRFDAVDWDAWFYGEGMPPERPVYDMSLSAYCQALADRWIEAAEDDLEQFKTEDIEDFRPQQTMSFLVYLINHTEPLSHVKIKALDDTYEFTVLRNSEIRFRWLQLCIKAKYSPIISEALDFVTEQGRMKFVDAIYRGLYNWEESRELALKNFEEHKDEMHLLTVCVVEKAMQLD